MGPRAEAQLDGPQRAAYKPCQMRRLALMYLLLSSAVGCGGPDEYAIVGTARAAGSDGTVQIETIEGGNKMVTIAIDHLPPAERLGPNLAIYAVWFIPPDRPPEKAGILEYDPSERTGRMMATTPHRQFTLQITAEPDATTVSPSDVVVASRVVGDNH